MTGAGAAMSGRQRQRPAVPDFRLLEPSLRWLSERGYLSGSWSRGDASDESDIDVYLRLSCVRDLRDHLNAQRVRWDSCVTGAITWSPEGVQVEVSDLYPRYQRGRQVEVYGVTFRT